MTVLHPLQKIGLFLGGLLLLSGPAWGQCFQPAENYVAGGNPQSVAVGDFNADGKADLATANYQDNSVSVLLGNGNGTFAAKADYPTGNLPRSVAVGDFNGDGKPDLAVANYTGNSVSVLLGNGDGTFGATADYAVGTLPATVVVGDFNGDAVPDLAVGSPTNVDTKAVAVLLGVGDGTFGVATAYGANFISYAVAVGDFNADANPDLAVADISGNLGNVAVLLGAGNGTFTVASDNAVGANPYSMAVGDFNADGKADLVTANIGNNNYGTVSVLLGAGDGTFGAAVNYGVGDRPLSVAVGDFNGDGKPDLAVANLDDNTVAVLLGNGDGTFGAAVDYGTGSGANAVAVGDFNGDGKPDLVTANKDDGTVSVLINGQPALYDVTGGGSYCAQGEGVAVGLSGSESGISYQLKRDGTAVGEPVSGTGSALSFGNQTTEGTYTVEATNGTCPAQTMTGSVSVTVNALPVVSLTGLASGYCQNASPFTLTGTPPGGTFKVDGSPATQFNPPSLTAGSHTVEYTYTDANGCTASTSQNVNLQAPAFSGTPTLAGAPVCPGQPVTVTFAVTCGEGVKFTAHLSDGSGSFGSPVSLGAVTSGGQVTIPAGTPPGTGYRIRVVSTSPALTSDPSAAFPVNALGAGSLAQAPTTPGRVCVGEVLAVTFASTGSCPFPTGNAFSVELSNALGSFANPTVLGTASVGTTNFSLPAHLPVGTGYRVRIVSSPEHSGVQTSPASLPFRVEGPSLSGVTPTVGGAPVCRGSAVTVSFSLVAGSCAFPGGTVFTAQLSSATGSFTNPTPLGPVLAGVSNSVTIPASVSAGTGYRLRVVSSQPQLASSPSGAFRVNACASRLSVEEATLVVMPNPVVGVEIRVRVSGMDNPRFRLTSGSGAVLGIEVQPEGADEWVLRPKQALATGVYALQASEGGTRLTQRVLVVE